MKVAGLFAGIGGLELGLSAAGHEASILCEIWEPARAVLASRFPDVPLAPDILGLRSLPGDTEIVVGGFPCQDLSQAGMTAGIGGKRSGLVGQVFRLLDRRRVPWVVLENVSFMLHLDQGKGLRLLVEAFEERGYRWAYRVVNSLAFLPQRRERVLFVATRTDADPADVLLADDHEPVDPRTTLATHAHGFYWTEGIRGLGWAPDAIPTLKNGSTVGIASPPAILLPGGDVVTPDIRDAERLQGFAPDWTAPAVTVGRASLRWSLVGNAVTVPVAEWLGKRLAEPGSYDPERDRELGADGRWPKAARFDGDRRHRVDIGSFPIRRARPSLVRFLRHPGKLLSARATRGFLGRTERSTLRFQPGFLDRLRCHLERMESGADGMKLDRIPTLAAE
ncbi:MAG: DNA (cytosine-5-)-methyltransferase [Rhodoplanes sp.]|uniref:DNA cytosine methyltransferase n=1 Tax=Rhodoplanes sp. TaxID=1968906 RepID=UPI0017FE594E|nr:DNA (cytosine-5-)-methyltransferase [Rhodoplanes sp.]NVO13640.1 DNA (cytosine-5-)-methyltransferase [Rhodoplanes sp.]